MDQSKRPLRIAITGASGLLGTALRGHWRSDGHSVFSLVRREPREGEIQWLPVGDGPGGAGVGWVRDGLAGMDVVVHLAGENVGGGRWSDARKRRIRDSRVWGTRTLVEAIGALAPEARPKVLLSASAVGYYGDRGDEILDEESDPGDGFLAEVCLGWEEEAAKAEALGLRVACLRLGVILDGQGGGLQKMLPAFRMGVGGKVGSGTQFMAWIHRDDAVRAFAWALEAELEGRINVVAPEEIRNSEFTKHLGAVLRRPTALPLPAFAAKAMLGEMGDALLLASTRVRPTALERSGFVFSQPDARGALEALLRP